MILSILISAIPERLEKAKKLITNLEILFKNDDVEILLFCDNMKMSLGEKRERLKNLAKGKYFAFIDDDDWFSEYYALIIEAAKENADVIAFKQRAIINGQPSIIDFDLNNENEEWQPGKEIKRKPFHICAWRRDKFQSLPFDFINYNEDVSFLKRAWAIAKTQTKINEILHVYNFDSKLSRAENGVS